MALSEIEKLERRYAENPQGLTFAPLAEVHRKNGDITRALELLRPGLTHHPDYIPASIVLGRCHLDLGDLPAAETAFTHVLALDGENVIALKALADITERQGRFDEAERWLNTLLAIDRSNDDARDQLGRVEATRRQTSSAAVVDLADGAGADETTPPEGDIEESVSNDTATAETPPAVSPPPMPEPPREQVTRWVAQSPGADTADVVRFDLEELDTSVELEGPRPEGIQFEQPVTLDDPVEPIAGLVGRDDRADVGSFDHVTDFRVETAEDIVLKSSGGSEFQVADASEELLGARDAFDAAPSRQDTAPVDTPAMGTTGNLPGGDTSAAAAPDDGLSPSKTEPPEPVAHEPAWREPAWREPAWGEPAWREPPPNDLAPSQPSTDEPAAATAGPWSTPVAEAPRPAEPDLVVTASMAELLLQQGHPMEALTVYRLLETRGGGEPRYREKIAELEHLTALPAAPAAPAAEPAAPAPAYSVLVTKGRSVQAFLRTVLAARPPAVAPGPSVHAAAARAGTASPEGAPTRPAHDSLSLSSVFGEESTPTAPAVPAAGSAAPQGGVSYDDFFGAAGGSAGPRPPRSADPKSDDLDQFHAWLQNLKR